MRSVRARGRPTGGQKEGAYIDGSAVDLVVISVMSVNGCYKGVYDDVRTGRKRAGRGGMDSLLRGASTATRVNGVRLCTAAPQPQRVARLTIGALVARAEELIEPWQLETPGCAYAAK